MQGISSSALTRATATWNLASSSTKSIRACNALMGALRMPIDGVGAFRDGDEGVAERNSVGAWGARWSCRKRWGSAQSKRAIGAKALGPDESAAEPCG